MNYDIFIFAGEPSGDLHGEALIQEIRKKDPSLKIAAVAGPRMRALGIDCILPMEEFQVMGFFDVFCALPRLIQHFYFISKQILAMNPRSAIFIDYPGFNLRMEKYLKKRGFKAELIHYICPSVWVHGKGRIKTMEQSLSQLLCILPFEKLCFEGSSLPVTYVGHPLVTRVKEHQFIPIEDLVDKKVVAIFPGSRTKEIDRNMPFYAGLIKDLMGKDKHLHFAISTARPSLVSKIEQILSAYGLDNTQRISFIQAGRTYDLMNMAYIAIAKSGTVTLELALHKVPTVVTYGATRLDIFIAQHILRVNLPYYSLPNILAGRKIFAELIGPRLTTQALLHEATSLLDPHLHTLCQDSCHDIITILGEKNASKEVADVVFSGISPL